MKVRNYIVHAATLLLVLACGCVQPPNKADGTEVISGATGSLPAKPEMVKTISKEINVKSYSKSYSKFGSTYKFTLIASHGDSGKAIFRADSSTDVVNIEIKGSDDFIDDIVSEVTRISGSAPTLTRRILNVETRTYKSYPSAAVDALDKELIPILSQPNRSSTTFNGSTTKTVAFDKGLQSVRYEHETDNSSLRITIEGAQDFVNKVKTMIETAKAPPA